MPRCNLTLKQKTQLIELSEHLTTGQLAKKFRVHATTVTRTIKKKERILDQASRVNPNFKTVQTNLRSEEHDTMVLDYIRSKQGTNVPISVTDICDKAVEFANLLGRDIKSRRAWWRRFRIRCNVVKMRLGSQGNNKSSDEDEKMITNKLTADKGPSPAKKIITLPTINLPTPLPKSHPENETPNNNDSQVSKVDGAEDDAANALETNTDLAESGSSSCRIENDKSAKESSIEDEESEPSVAPTKQNTSPSKKRTPRKARGRAIRRGRKKKDKKSVINFTFKIKKTPSKSVPVK